jgi:hypothetical protein
MDKRELDEVTDPARYRDHVVQKGIAADHHHAGPVETVRAAEYKGHRIVIRTSYALEVDGRPVTGHLAVGNDGRVTYHAVPNLSFASAVDLAKQLIDAFPEEFQAARGIAAGEDEHGGHGTHD